MLDALSMNAFHRTDHASSSPWLRSAILHPAHGRSAYQNELMFPIVQLELTVSGHSGFWGGECDK
jgi:hypothetical protein